MQAVEAQFLARKDDQVVAEQATLTAAADACEAANRSLDGLPRPRYAQNLPASLPKRPSGSFSEHARKRARPASNPVPTLADFVNMYSGQEIRESMSDQAGLS